MKPYKYNLNFLTQSLSSVTHTDNQGSSPEKNSWLCLLLFAKIHTPVPRLDQNKMESQVSLIGNSPKSSLDSELNIHKTIW